MPRALWRGAISFGMVAIPVRLYLATEEKASVRFHLLCPRDGARIRNLRWCPTEEREISWSEVVRGYEVARDEYVEFTDADFEKLPLPSARTLEIAEFCAADEIPDLYVDRAYFIEPEEAGRKPYALLREALRRTGRVAVGKVALRDREHLARITGLDGGLVMETLHWPDEVRSIDELKLPGKETLAPAEVDMAVMLVDSLSRSFDPAAFKDEYKTAVGALVAQKLGKEKRKAVRAPAEPPKVVDLMAALKASVEAAKSADPARAAGRRRKTTAGKAG